MNEPEFGKAVEAGQGTKPPGWIVGNFVSRETLRFAEGVEVKWRAHPAGEKTPDWKRQPDKQSIALLVSGRFRFEFRSGAGPYELNELGHYIAWRDEWDHKWEAITDSIVITIRSSVGPCSG